MFRWTEGTDQPARKAQSEDSDSKMRMVIYDDAGRACNLVGNVVPWLNGQSVYGTFSHLKHKTLYFVQHENRGRKVDTSNFDLKPR